MKIKEIILYATLITAIGGVGVTWGTLQSKADNTEKVVEKVEKKVEKSEEKIIKNDMVDVEQSVLLNAIAQQIEKLDKKLDLDLRGE